MIWYIDAGIIFLLAIVVFQDFKHHKISWFLIPFLFAFIVCKALLAISLNDLINESLINSGFIFTQLFILTVYFSIKNRKITNIINSYLGIGDVLFFIVICAAFSPINFIVFYLLGLIIVLLTYSMSNFIYKNQTKEIPLAGAMSSLLIMLFIINVIYTKMNFYNDEYFTSYFIK